MMRVHVGSESRLVEEEVENDGKELVEWESEKSSEGKNVTSRWAEYAVGRNHGQVTLSVILTNNFLLQACLGSKGGKLNCRT
jgi:hypothetical protein